MINPGFFGNRVPVLSIASNIFEINNSKYKSSKTRTGIRRKQTYKPKYKINER